MKLERVVEKIYMAFAWLVKDAVFLLLVAFIVIYSMPALTSCTIGSVPLSLQMVSYCIAYDQSLPFV